MAIVRKFYGRERSGEVETFSLARDVLTDRVFVIHSRGHGGPDLSDHEDQISIEAFLQGEGPEQAALRELIGTLVVEN